MGNSIGFRFGPYALLLIGLAWGLLRPTPVQAQGADRVAVLLMPADPEHTDLAANLTEVVIARIADRQGATLADAHEFRERLGVEGDHRVHECLEDVTCLGRVGVVLNVRRVVSGTIGKAEKGYMVSMVLTDIESGEVQNRFFQLVSGGLEMLIAAIQKGTDDLFVPKALPGRVHVQTEPAGARVTVDQQFVGTSPVFSGPLSPGFHQLRVEPERRLPWTSDVEIRPDTDLRIVLNDEQFERERVWPAYLAYGSAAGAVAATTIGVVFGLLSQRTPTGATREAIQSDIDSNREMSTRANIMYGVGGLMLVTSATTAWIFSDDIFD